MKIKKGTLLNIRHQRKGRFVGIAREDFDTQTAEFFPITLAHGGVADHKGLIKWIEGDSIECRASLCSIEKVRADKASQ